MLLRIPSKCIKLYQTLYVKIYIKNEDQQDPTEKQNIFNVNIKVNFETIFSVLFEIERVSHKPDFFASLFTNRAIRHHLVL